MPRQSPAFGASRVYGCGGLIDCARCRQKPIVAFGSIGCHNDRQLLGYGGRREVVASTSALCSKKLSPLLTSENSRNPPRVAILRWQIALSSRRKWVRQNYTLRRTPLVEDGGTFTHHRPNEARRHRSPKVEILHDSGTSRFDGTAWSSTYPAVEVFDGVFVAENVHSGEVVDIEHKRNFYRVIIGESGVALATRDVELAARSRKRQVKSPRRNARSSPTFRGA